MSATPPVPTLRADAERNRRRILAAANEAFAQDGIAAGVDDIARRAGVGIATLYRRFPTKDDLILALLEDKLVSFIEMARAAQDVQDAQAAFAGLMREIVARRACDRSFDEVYSSPRYREHPNIAALYDDAYAALDAVLERARAVGAVPEDYAFSDLTVWLHGLGAMASLMRDIDPMHWERTLAIFLAGLEVTQRLPGQAPPPEKVRTASESR